MAQSLSIPLPEITIEDFSQSWMRFELVATAKKWEGPKQLSVIPTVLRGKLVDYYIDLEESEKADIDQLKKALTERAGLMIDPLATVRRFTARSQAPQKRVSAFATELKKLFKQAYPSEATSSSVLLQRYLTGLRPAISRQILLKGKPTSLEQAMKEAAEVEYALDFYKTKELQYEVNAVQEDTAATVGNTKLNRLEDTMQKMMERLETMESRLRDHAATRTRDDGATGTSRRAIGARSERRTRPRNNLRCFLCGEEGHFQRQCPLNFAEPARMVGGSWRTNQ